MIWSSIVCLIVAAIALFFPELPYSLFESWKHENDSGEPSRAYLLRMRVAGGILLLVGIFTLIANLVA